MRASLRTLRFMLYLPSAGLQSAGFYVPYPAVRRLHFNFRDNRASCGSPVRAYAAAAPSERAGFSDGLSATVMDIKI